MSLFQVYENMSKFKDKSWRDISIYPGFAYWITPVPGDQFLSRCMYCKGTTYSSVT